MQYSPGPANSKRSKGETLTVDAVRPNLIKLQNCDIVFTLRISLHQLWHRKMSDQLKASAKGETEFELLAPVRGRVVRVDGVNGYYTYEKGERRFHLKVTLTNCPVGASSDAAEESATAVFDMWDKAGWSLLLHMRVLVFLCSAVLLCFFDMLASSPASSGGNGLRFFFSWCY